MSSLERILALENSPQASNDATREFSAQLEKKYFDSRDQLASIFVEPFLYLYKDVIGEGMGFKIEDVLPLSHVTKINQQAKGCLKIVKRFSAMPLNDDMYSWIQRAIKMTDVIAVHYLQDVAGVTILNRVRGAGTERSRYRQIEDLSNEFSIAGKNVDELYQVRNGLEHRTFTDPVTSRQEILVPDYKGAKRRVMKLFPPVIKSFRNVYFKRL